MEVTHIKNIFHIEYSKAYYTKWTGTYIVYQRCSKVGYKFPKPSEVAQIRIPTIKRDSEGCVRAIKEREPAAQLRMRECTEQIKRNRKTKEE